MSAFRTACIGLGIAASLCITFPASAQYHSADTDKDYAISMSELLRVVQFFHSDGFHCTAGTEDGFDPGPGDTNCMPHNSDYHPQDWHINLSELLRVFQFYNSDGYHMQCHSEDTFTPGPGSHDSCSGEHYTLTYSADANGAISGISPQTVEYGASGSVVTAIPHYLFVQWSDGRTDNPRQDVYVRTDITVTAFFAVNGPIYVTHNGTGNGSSWASPLGSIQEGLNTAKSGDEVWVASGTYIATTEPVVTLKSGVALYGGFAGTETTRAARNWNTNVTTIDGENTRCCVTGANNATLDGFTITRGCKHYGGGMYNWNVSPTVNNCIFTSNSADRDGGGMCNGDYAYPVVTNCTFTGNSATYGGGMRNDHASPTLTNCIFTSNSASCGGGLHNENASPSVTNCTFSINSATNGGGMDNDTASPSVTNCIFASNSATNGGGMLNNTASPSVTNCTFISNSASRGGGLYNENASPNVTNCTFTANSASYSGGGMYNYDASPSVTNCILWGDSSEMYNEESTPSVTYSCVQDGYSGNGNINSDPVFVNMAVCSVQLLTGSPCVGAGTATGAPTTDILGQPRLIDTGKVTIGAYEGSLDQTALIHLAIAILPPDSGSTIPSEGMHSCAPGDRIVISAHSSASMHLGNWTIPINEVIGTHPSVMVVMGANNRTVTANFIINRYTLTYISGAHGSISGDSPQTVEYGGAGMAVTAVPAPYHHFVHWSDGSTDNPRTDVNVAADISVTAVFASDGVIWYVVPGGTGNGSAWDSPIGSIQEALDVAEANDEIWVAAGTYISTTDPVVTMKEGVALYGGFSGTETTRDARNWNINVTTIDGEDTRRCVLGADYATLDGFTITRGYAIYESGGGMYNVNASPTVTNCTFTANISAWGPGGGGMYNEYASPSVTNCMFTANRASNRGGGMYNYVASPSVTNCTFTTNMALWGDGGGMCNGGASPSVTNCTFTANSATVFGGGMFNGGASPIVTNCTFTANSAFGGIDWIYNDTASPSVTNNVFIANASTESGGGMFNGSSSPVVTNCILWGNSSEIDNSSTIPSVTYSCVHGDAVYPGAGNINTDPLFINAPDDLRLQDTSPCIDSGTSEGAPATDILGVTRPQGGGVDMGAYEQ